MFLKVPGPPTCPDCWAVLRPVVRWQAGRPVAVGFRCPACSKGVFRLPWVAAEA